MNKKRQVNKHSRADLNLNEILNVHKRCNLLYETFIMMAN